jgi:hypothetical protein
MEKGKERNRRDQFLRERMEAAKRKRGGKSRGAAEEKSKRPEGSSRGGRRKRDRGGGLGRGRFQSGREEGTELTDDEG